LPNIKAAEKWVLQSEKREARNKGIKSRLKTLYKAAVTSDSPETARAVESAFDKAAAKGIVHPNKAARKKARLSKAVQRAAAAPAKSAKGKSSRSKK
jgi:small subunit ribosomal protein S20